MVCMVTATDSQGGSINASASLTISNTPPEVTSLNITPSNPDSHTNTLTCNALGSDADGDSVTFNYEWLVDGVTQSETSNMFSSAFILSTNK